MATYNGADFLAEQLGSIARQTHGNWSLWISDDGSTDATLDIVSDFKRGHPGHRIEVRRGPGAGSTRNFLSLLGEPTVCAAYVALADQDDVWLPGKLARAVSQLSSSRDGQQDTSRPSLYGCRTIIADAKARPLGKSRLISRPGCFANALVQNIAGGNTMVMNRAAHRLVAAALPGDTVACHDWWIYQLVSGAGGDIIYDPSPWVLYRQHGGNQIGANSTVFARLTRLHGLLNRRFSNWNTLNLTALKSVAPHLTPEARNLVAEFENLRQRRGPAALTRLSRARLFRQSVAGNLSLRFGAFFGLL